MDNEESHFENLNKAPSNQAHPTPRHTCIRTTSRSAVGVCHQVLPRSPLSGIVPQRICIPSFDRRAHRRLQLGHPLLHCEVPPRVSTTQQLLFAVLLHVHGNNTRWTMPNAVCQCSPRCASPPNVLSTVGPRRPRVLEPCTAGKKTTKTLSTVVFTTGHTITRVTAIAARTPRQRCNAHSIGGNPARCSRTPDSASHRGGITCCPRQRPAARG